MTGFRRILDRLDQNVDAPVIYRWTATALVVQLAVFAFLILATHGMFFKLPHPCTTDYVSFFAAGKLADGVEPALAYDRALHYAAEQQATSAGIDYVHFFYPPVYLLICGLLAHLPYLLSFVLFELATLALSLSVLRSIAGGTGHLWWLSACGFSPLIWNVGLGQNACLTAGLFGGATLLLHRRRPIAAGMLFSCLLFKPHVGLLIPVALAAARSWRAFLAAAAGVGLLVAASGTALGWRTWFVFVDVIMRAQQGFSAGQVVPFDTTASAQGAARMLGAGSWPAHAFEGIVALGVVTAVAWSWRKPDDGSGARYASLAAGTVLIMPVVLFYDTVLLLVAAAWLYHAAARSGTRYGERIALASVWLAGLVCYPATQAIHIPIAFAMALTTFILATTRQMRPIMFLPGSNDQPSSSLAKGLPLFNASTPELAAARTAVVSATP